MRKSRRHPLYKNSLALRNHKRLRGIPYTWCVWRVALKALTSKPSPLFIQAMYLFSEPMLGPIANGPLNEGWIQPIYLSANDGVKLIEHNGFGGNQAHIRYLHHIESNYNTRLVSPAPIMG
ncbi:unnamed protein product [Amaranthus hypochondriacus]